MQQVLLRQGERQFVTWVDQEVKKGDAIRLTNDHRFFNVVEVYDDRDKTQINRNWRVGGIE